MNSNFFTINGKNYGENWAKWQKGKFYEVRIPSNIEKQFGIIYYVATEKNYDKKLKSFTWSPIKESDFYKYFIDSDELRNQKIDKILCR